MGWVDIGHAERCFQDRPPCGDAMVSVQRGSLLRVMLSDGIGHGPHAHGVVSQLNERFLWMAARSHDLGSIADCLQGLHDLLREGSADRQAAVAIVDVDADTGGVCGLSVGNVKLHQLSSAGRVSFPCINGMVGGRMPAHLRLTECFWPADALLIMHTDGVSSRGALPFLQQLAAKASSLQQRAEVIAESLIQRFAKISDDASCVVMLRREGSPR